MISQADAVCDPGTEVIHALNTSKNQYSLFGSKFKAYSLVCDFVMMSSRLAHDLAGHAVARLVYPFVNFVTESFLQLGRLHFFVFFVVLFDWSKIHLETCWVTTQVFLDVKFFFLMLVAELFNSLDFLIEIIFVLFCVTILAPDYLHPQCFQGR